MILGTVEIVQKICFLFYDLANNQICNMYNERKKQKIFRIEIIAKNERKTDFCFA